MDTTLQEIAKHLGRPIDTACKLIENMLSLPTKKLGDLFGDQISYWQWSNRLRIAEKATKKLASKGLTFRELPLDFTIPYLRECGDAENPDLQEWWAELLVSSIEDDSMAHVAYITTLRSMSAADIRFLDTLIKSVHAEKAGMVEPIAALGGLSIKQARMGFNNLRHLGFFTPTGKRLTGFAYDFLKACCPNQNCIDAYREKEEKMPRHLIKD
jgi:hypothetical protein